MTESGKILSETYSVCPECLARIPAYRVLEQQDVYLVKNCPQHGSFKTIVWRGNPPYSLWPRPKILSRPSSLLTKADQGCPFDCGLCSEHKQQPCCVLLEVTQRCDLGCPVCFASAGGSKSIDPDLKTVEMWYRKLLAAGGPFNIHLSGGEPCLRDDLPEIIAIGKQLGFEYFQVNTNGLRIARDPDYLDRLKQAGLSVVYLQFDATQDEAYRKIRGRDLLSLKQQAIESCRQVRLGVVLVPTLLPGVNTDQVGSIIRFALHHHPVVRSVHFQPISYFGRYPVEPTNASRLTIPEIICSLEEQTDGLIRSEHFGPTGSENSFCSFHASYVIMPGGELKAITQKKTAPSCCTPPDKRSGVARAQDFVARNWAMPPDVPQQSSSPGPNFGGWDAFLARARTHLFSISGMAFQDAWNLDQQLLQECCILIVSPDGRLIPFCSYNLTDRNGNGLYRSRSPQGTVCA